jgi:anti-sigma regulatory factor (Ser/Thr protein kinase)/CheY-like chemotaxis protein
MDPQSTKVMTAAAVARERVTAGRVLLVGGSQQLQRVLAADEALRGHEIQCVNGNIEAIQQIRRRIVDVVLTSPSTTIAEDLALVRELASTRPGIRTIVFSHSATREELIAALSAHVFACFTLPFDEREVVDMVRSAMNASDWRDGIEVVSGLPDWFTLRVSCRLLTAARLVRFMTEYPIPVSDEDHEMLMTAFREMLLNAIGHGGGFDPESVVEVTAAKTARAIVYHFRDPGEGFKRNTLTHAAASPSREDVESSAIVRQEKGLRPGGFGILITRQIADELVYNERGNEVLLIKHLS